MRSAGKGPEAAKQPLQKPPAVQPVVRPGGAAPVAPFQQRIGMEDNLQRQQVAQELLGPPYGVAPAMTPR